MVVPCIWFEIRVSYQLDANICFFFCFYFSSTCFGLYAHLQEQYTHTFNPHTHTTHTSGLYTYLAYHQ